MVSQDFSLFIVKRNTQSRVSFPGSSCTPSATPRHHPAQPLPPFQSLSETGGGAKKCPSDAGLVARISTSETLSLFSCDWSGRKKWKV